MVGFLGIGLIIAAGIVSGQFSQLGAVVLKSQLTLGSNNAGNAIPVNRDQILLLFGEVIFVVIAVKLAETSDDAKKVITALLVGLWFVWLMFNSKMLSDWITKVQPKPPGA